MNKSERKSKSKKPNAHPQRRNPTANTFHNSGERKYKQLRCKTQKSTERETKQLSNDRERKWFSICNRGDRNDKFLWRKPKIDRWEKQRIGRKIKDKTNYPSATVENQTTYPSATVENQTKYFRFRHASNAFKGNEKSLSYSGLLQVLKGETKQVVNQFNPLEESLLDQLNEESRSPKPNAHPQQRKLTTNIFRNSG